MFQLCEFHGVSFNSFNLLRGNAHISKEGATANHKVGSAGNEVLEGDDVGGFEHQHLKEAARSKGLGGCGRHDLSEANGLSLARAFFGQLVDDCEKRVNWNIALDEEEV